MTSYLSSLQLPSFLSSASDAGDAATAPPNTDPAKDAPLHALPKPEADALAALRDAARPILAEHRAKLPPCDAFAQSLAPARGAAPDTDTDTDTDTETDADAAEHLDAALLRLARHHALSVPRATRHLRRIVAWRASSCVASRGPEERFKRGCGLPVAELGVSADGEELLCYSAGDRYIRADVVRETQYRAVEKMFDYLLHDERGPRARRCTIVVDFKHFSAANVDLVGTKAGICTYLHYFPDLLTRVLLVNYPPIVYGVWRAVRPLLDARTAHSVVFVPSVADLARTVVDVFGAERVPCWLGGEMPAAAVTLYNGCVLQPHELDERFPGARRAGGDGAAATATE